MKTLLLVNMTDLADVYPEDVSDIQKAIEAFARRYNAGILDIDEIYQEKTGKHIKIPEYPNPELTKIAREIKSEIISRTGGKLDYLILVGDENIIPMWEISLDRLRLHTDSFFADLNGDGLPEVVVTRILGNAEAMQRQLSETPQVGGPEASILCSEDTRIHLETQRFLDVLTQQGHQVAVMGRGGAEQLPQSDLIIHFGHGTPKSLSNRFGEDFVTAKGMPTLSRHPLRLLMDVPPRHRVQRCYERF